MPRTIVNPDKTQTPAPKRHKAAAEPLSGQTPTPAEPTFYPDEDLPTAEEAAGTGAGSDAGVSLNPRRRLTDDEVVAIRRMYHVERKPITEICIALGGLPQSTVYTCARGASYRHVPMPDGKYATPERVAQRRTKVSQEVVDGIRDDYKSGMSQAEIARKYGQSQPYVRSVLFGKFRANTTAAKNLASKLQTRSERTQIHASA